MLRTRLAITDSNLATLMHAPPATSAQERERRRLVEELVVPHLAPPWIESVLSYCGVDHSVRREIADDVTWLVTHDTAKRLVSHLIAALFGSDIDPAQWPDSDKGSPTLAVLYLVVGAAMVPLVQRTHRCLGVPEEITRGTCAQIAAFCSLHQLGRDGRPGILPKQLYWLRNYPAGRLFRVGRFEYRLEPYRHAGPILRHRHHGWKIALADPESWVSADGTVLVDPPLAESPPAFQPALSRDAKMISGHPVDPHGRVVSRPETFHLTEWAPVVEPEDTVLDIHIPAGGGMGDEAVRASLTDAFAFFRRFFSDRPVNAAMCRSWIFNTQIEERLPESNLAAFMREVYLLPARSTGTDGLFFLFGRTYDRLADYPRRTRLHHALLDILEEGGSLRTTSMIVFRDDLSRYGAQPYRSDWRAWRRT